MLDFLQPIKRNIATSIMTDALSYVDMIKLCHGELTGLHLHLEMFLCSIPPEPT